MTYIKRNLIPIIVGLVAVAGIAISTVAIVHRFGDGDRGARFAAGGRHERGDRFASRVPGGRQERRGGPVLGVQLGDGLKITAVISGSAAQQAGIEVGDAITSVAGRPVKTREDVARQLAALAPGSDYALQVKRGDKTVDLTAHRAAAPVPDRYGDRRSGPRGAQPAPGRPGQPPAPGRALPPRDAPGPRLGVSVEVGTGGVRVAAVAPGSPAETAGVRAGDIVAAANGKPTATVQALQAVVAEAGSAGTLTLAVTRDGAAMTLTAKLAPPAPRPAPSRAST
ncbi:MAG: PDZ domain-containing protein [Dehalococcoidia bacterium]|nr:PDZ domain-containing protein [Dehalococcoidia bacterium]